MRELVAIEDTNAVAAAISTWVEAFKNLGVKVTNGAKPIWWIESTGVWIKSAGKVGPKGKYWNALGAELSPDSLSKGLVQVNPPVGGNPIYENQGVIARDRNGKIWILHRGRINVDNERGILHDYPADAAALGVEAVNVSFNSGRKQLCYVVTPIGKPQDVVQSTKRFVNLCRVVRARSDDGDEVAEFQRRALSFEEPSGDYVIPARGSIKAQRIHHDVCEALKTELSSRKIQHSNGKIGHLGPDLYSTNQITPALFEIKTASTSDDLLKAVGQLFVYEKLLGSKCRRVMVIPLGVGKKNRELIESLDIEIVDYRRHEKQINFDWPESFFEVK